MMQRMLHTHAVLLVSSAAAHGKSAGTGLAAEFFLVSGVSSLSQVLLFPMSRPLPDPAIDCGWVCGYAHGSTSVVSSTLEELDSITLFVETESLTGTWSLSVGLRWWAANLWNLSVSTSPALGW